MPIPIALAAAGIGAASGLANSIGQANQNKRNRAFTQQMYDRQRSDALLDWNRVNEYNSPQAQMKRFQDAGLNPNLIYGQSNTAQGMATPDLQAPQTRNPEWGEGLRGGGLSAIMANADLGIKQAQTDNLKAQNSVFIEEAMLKRAQTRATQIAADRGKFGLDFDTEFRDISGDAKRESLRQLKVSTDLSINRDIREALSNSSYLNEALERIQTMKLKRAETMLEMNRIRSTIQNLKSDDKLKQLDIDLRKQGINPTSPVWTQVLGRAINGLMGTDDGDPKSTWYSKFFNK